MRRALLVSLLSLLPSLAPSLTAASAETGVHLGGGPRWGDAGNDVAFVLRASTGLAPFITFGAELYGLCAGGRELDLDFGGAAISTLLSPPDLGPLGLELGLEAGIVPLDLDPHGRDGLAAYIAIETAASIDLGPLVNLRLAFDHVLTGGDARRALQSQLLFMVGLTL